ncbi:hypothetical protein Dsin_026702 [Dipteronia sinensis]|uniref:CCHC-type domain-containing protein n=1 Tax=Dipteronia sinensis TaxID=43782 RepID=A0AAE0DY46_9ROSI|nr:hypothetical protein Dsin_026702 [Dipteronia sinensis]
MPCGKILTTKLVNRNVFVEVMNRIWLVVGGVEIEPIKGNIFAFYFKNTEYRQMKLNRGPWSFDRAIIVFEKPAGTGDVLDMSFNMVEFWILIHNLPLICMNEEIGVIFLRLRVTVPNAKPLQRSLCVDLPDSGKVSTMLLCYERLFDYCFRCGRLGHLMEECVDKESIIKVPSEATRRLKVWLRAASPPKQTFTGMGRVGKADSKSWGKQNWKDRKIVNLESNPGGRRAVDNKQLGKQKMTDCRVSMVECLDTSKCNIYDPAGNVHIGGNLTIPTSKAHESMMLGDNLEAGGTTARSSRGSNKFPKDNLQVGGFIRGEAVVHGPGFTSDDGGPLGLLSNNSLKEVHKCTKPSKWRRVGKGERNGVVGEQFREILGKRGSSILEEEIKPELMFLMETKCDNVKMEKWRVQLGYYGKLVVNSIGRSGGLCIFWDCDMDVTLLMYSQDHIDVNIKEKYRQLWRFTGFYGHPDRSQRKLSWTFLRRLAGMSSLPWVCMGDFNEVLRDDEKLGGNEKRWREMSDFREALEEANLKDVGFIGPKFTWSNKRDGSDHRPFVLEIPNASNLYTSLHKGRRFFFEECWIEDTDCKDIVVSVWRGKSTHSKVQNVINNIESCGRFLHVWNIRKRKNLPQNLQEKIDALRKACKGDVLIPWKDMKKLEAQLDEVLDTEERY